MMRYAGVFLLLLWSGPAFAQTVVSSTRDPLTRYDEDGKVLGTVPASSLIGQRAEETPLGLVKVTTAAGSVYVNGNALKLDRTVSRPPCRPIETHREQESVRG